MSGSFKEKAKSILKSNDRGGFTVPTSNLYPYQWNWDSAFAALGFATFDRNRAWCELELLFEAQWEDGMLPHIVFRNDDPRYFPGPSFWQSGTTPPTSGHSQPPVTASIVWSLVQSGDHSDLERARKLFPSLLKFHNWFHCARDPDGTGLIGIIHPWASGRDNSPDWDFGMAGIEVADDLGDYKRQDTNFVDAEERPTSDQYDRYLTLIKFGREHNWDQQLITKKGPFLVADPGINFILMRADRDLLQLAGRLGIEDCKETIESWIAKSREACRSLWNPDIECYAARDMKSGQFSEGISNAAMLAFYADAGSEREYEKLARHAEEILQIAKYAFPSWDPRHDRFDSRRYWRGPTWAIMNYMIAEGMAEQGFDDLAARIHHDTLQLIQTSGFCEYFDPITGDGLGGQLFTWTAAILLVLADSSSVK